MPVLKDCLSTVTMKLLILKTCIINIKSTCTCKSIMRRLRKWSLISINPFTNWSYFWECSLFYSMRWAFFTNEKLSRISYFEFSHLENITKGEFIQCIFSVASNVINQSEPIICDRSCRRTSWFIHFVSCDREIT